MSYSVTCPSCNTSFPVDPAKVPEEGVLAQCSMCPEVFEVPRPDKSEDTAPIDSPPVEDNEPTEELEAPDVPLDSKDFIIETAEGVLEMDAPAATVPEPTYETTDSLGGLEITLDEPIAAPEPVPEDAPVAQPEAEVPPEPVAAATPSAEETAAEPDAPPVTPIQFGHRDPSDKARSLARSLVSDIIAYHKEKHTQSLEAGTLVEDFDEEIQKSWKEYTDQVDADVVASSTFFNDALNEILAGGESVFTLDG
ncbi:MAG: hypothetical protein BMS9Abin29_1273 [Gemmatimonadota bacterium]|nr:MAG: hypothetical protein BMS9Abin29_1273 [Gemmatimonadota bacterium]